MSKRNTKKKVEYKDTFDFKLFPEYQYTKHQKKRLRLFQGRIEHWKKAVNYADSFPGDDKINLLYLIGYNDSMKKYVMNTKNNVVVLCACFTREDLKLYDEYWELMAHLSNSRTIQEDKIREDHFAQRDKIRKALRKKEYKNDKDLLAWNERLKHADSVIDAYDKLSRNCEKYFKRYTIVDKLHPVKTISHDDLDWIIERYYPRGREQYGVSGRIYGTKKTMDKAILCGLNGDNVNSVLGIKSEKHSYDICKPVIKRCLMNINTEIRDHMRVNLVRVFEEMTKPPYGWSYLDAHAAYCFGAAMKEYLDKAYIWDSVASWKTNLEYTLSLLSHIVCDDINRRRTYYLYVDYGWHMANRLNVIFGIEQIEPLDWMVTNLRRKIEKETRWPVSLIDERLGGFIAECNCNTNEDRYNGYILPEYKNMQDKNYLKQLEKYLTFEKCEVLRHKYESIHSVARQIIEDEIRLVSDAEFDEIYKLCTTECSGWLWTKDTLIRCVKKHLLVSDVMNRLGPDQSDFKYCIGPLADDIVYDRKMKEDSQDCLDRILNGEFQTIEEYDKFIKERFYRRGKGEVSCESCQVLQLRNEPEKGLDRAE